ncbi:DUF6875 domain-containing protein [Embleya sp. NPDC059237]|uniref:DUF6875 domain-containing protein n=1 Tax=Embleya sp. NPDC059237 TaxID=3346784 RepID=UPI00368AEF95
MTTSTEPFDGPSVGRYRSDTVVFPAHGYDERVDTDLRVLVDWLQDDVSRPHPDLKRPGPLCPFVPAALNAGTLRFEFRYQVTGDDPGELRDVLADRLRRFPPPAAGAHKTSLECLIMALPDLAEENWTALDEAHTDLKDLAVDHGLMIGQFHPDCDERSVRNHVLRASRSPVPLLAARHMAPHDILFLHDCPRWFDAYHKQFSAQFVDGRVNDPLMLGLFAAAKRRYRQREAS